MNKSRFCLLIAFCLFGSACGILKQIHPVVHFPEQDPQKKQQAERLLSTLMLRNKERIPFKGIGHLRLETDGQLRLSCKMAWTGGIHDELRIELLSPTAQPFLSLSYDGHRIYLFNHGKNDFYVKETVDPSLEDLLNVPITIRTIHTLLSGNVPVIPHDRLCLFTQAQQKTKYLMLRGKNQNAIEEIYLDEQDSPFQVMLREPEGDLLYRIELLKKNIPPKVSAFYRKIKITTQGNTRLTLTIRSNWTGFPLTNGLFILTPSRK